MFGTACQQSYSHLPQNAIFVDSAALHGLYNLCCRRYGVQIAVLAPFHRASGLQI